jgi:hypothetical protein
MGSSEVSDTRGGTWNSVAGAGVQVHVQDALDTDLDAYLDRELSILPAQELSSTPAAQKPAERLQGVLALAAEEEQWMRTLPPPEQPAENSKDLEGSACELPEHLKPKPAPVMAAPVSVEPVLPVVAYVPVQASLPGLTAVPVPVPPWSRPVVAAPDVPHRSRWRVAGALAGMGAAGALAASLLWMARDIQLGHEEASVVAETVTAAPPMPSVPERFVESSPLQRQEQPLVAEWSAAGPLPGPGVPGRQAGSPVVQAQTAVAVQPKTEPVAQAVAAPEPKAEPLAREVAPKPQLSEVTGAMARATQRLGYLSPVGAASAPKEVRGTTPAPAPSVKAEDAKPRRAAAEAKPEPRRLIEDPYLEDTEAETPFMQQPRQAAPAPAAVAKAMPAPSAPPEPNLYEDLDEDFARELGFTPGSKPRVPESNGVKSVWVPPDPANDLPESLAPEQIQQVVVANQPAIVSCIKRFKDTVPGVSGGKFVVRWFVHPDGSTYGQMVETKELRGTALGTCIERLVPGWKFPKHRVKQQEPIRFPFIF